MQPVFPPIPFTNHYTLATGLFADSHRIVDNVFTDQRTGQQFNYKDVKSKTNSSWWLGKLMMIDKTAKFVEIVIDMVLIN